MNKYIKDVEILEVKQGELVVKITFDMSELVFDFVNMVHNIKEILSKIVENIGVKNLRMIADEVEEEE